MPLDARLLAIALCLAGSAHPLRAGAQSIDALRVAATPLTEPASPPRLRLPPMRPECTPWVVSGVVAGGAAGLAWGVATIAQAKGEGRIAALYFAPMLFAITVGGGVVVGGGTGYLACNIRYIGHDPDPAAGSPSLGAPWPTAHLTVLPTGR